MHPLICILLGAYLAAGVMIAAAVKDSLDFDSREPQWKQWLLAVLGGVIWPIGTLWGWVLHFWQIATRR